MNQDTQKIANVFARKYGYGRATKVTFDPTLSDHKLGEVVQGGYRKNTTGEYVPNAYRSNFGWKNTYYQHVVCEVILAMEAPNA